MNKNKQISSLKLLKNVSFSIIAQVVSLCVSFILNLIVPKYISELQYANWQTYVLYSSYVGILHFGILDGMMLKYSEYDYDDLDKSKIRGLFQFVFCLNVLLCILVAMFGMVMFSGEAKTISIFVAIAIIVKNLVTYNSYLFQLTNRINRYAFFIITDKVFYGMFVILCLLVGIQDFWVFCLADILSDTIACIYTSRYNKGLYFGGVSGIKNCFSEVKSSFNCGVMLLIATWSSMLLVGSAKMVTQWHWDSLVFGKVSFAFSISSLFLTFITAISVVLFPSLKRMDQDRLPAIYVKIREMISPVLLLALLCYYPGSFIIEKWLPNYSQSLSHLGLLLPSIVFTSKVSLLTNNYLKAFRQEKTMLIINVVSVAFAFVGDLLFAFVLDNLVFVMLWTVAVIMMRSIVSEIVVMRIIKVRLIFDFILEAILTIIFILCTMLLSRWIACLVYAIALVIYLIIKRDTLKPILGQVKNVLHR